LSLVGNKQETAFVACPPIIFSFPLRAICIRYIFSLVQMSKENHEEKEEDQVEKIRISLRIAPGVNDVSIEVSSDPIAVPADLRRKGLSALVNHMLGRRVRATNEEEKSVDEPDDEDNVLPALPFDFILNGRLLRMGVEAAARRDGLSLEEAIELQYFVAQPAPRHSTSSEDIPDWVSTLSFSSGIQHKNLENSSQYVDGLLFCGCYDGSIRALSPYNCSVITATKSQGAHSGAIKCMDTKLMNIGSADDEVQFLVASGSMDQTLFTHTLSTSRSDDTDIVANPSLTLHCSYIDGHTNSIESLALDRTLSGEMILASGDWDGSLCLWKVPRHVDGTSMESYSKRGGVSSKKRLKVDQKSTIAECSATVSPVAKWDSHTASVSGIVWGVRGDNGKKHLITSSWDHSCKVWDVERQECALTLNGSRVVSALGRCINSDIIATGHVS
jgi:ribosome biogenesis protein YTM1